MTGHFVYSTIVEAVRKGKLKEPFTRNDLIKACPNLNESTACTFLSKHRKDNPSGTSELFILVSTGKFKLIRPFKYGY